MAIIGAGPAGSTLAALLARAGVKVVLIDRDLFPRDKLCGEFVSYDGLPILRHLNVMQALGAAPKISECEIVGQRQSYPFELPQPAIGVSRLLLDQLLVRAAETAGATLLTGRVVTRLRPSVLLEDGTEVQARLLVGAWGRWGRFDQTLRRPFVRDRRHRYFGFKRHYVSSGALTSTIRLHSYRDGYLGASPIEGERINICGLVRDRRIRHLRGGWQAFTGELRAERADIEDLYEALTPDQEGFLSCEPVIFRARSAVEDSIFMVGDASGIVDPLTGNGMSMAMQSALLGARWILQSLSSASDRVRLATGYMQDHARFFAPRIRWSRRLASALSRPWLVDAAVARLRSERFGRFLVQQTRASAETVEGLVDQWSANSRKGT